MAKKEARKKPVAGKKAGKAAKPAVSLTAEKIVAKKETVEGKEVFQKRAEGEKKEAIAKKEKKAAVERPKRTLKVLRAIRKTQKKIFSKKRPKFRGRFGKKSVRRKSIEKWQKWRKPRGIDITLRKHYGRIPNSGYGSPREIRGLHPSGLREKMIRNLNELDLVSHGLAIRLQSGIGLKKRRQIIEEANKKGIKILN